MRITYILTPAVAAMIGLGGCGALQSTGVPDEPDRLVMQSFTIRTGKVTPADLANRLPLVLARHGYTIERQEVRGRRIFMRTQWKARDAFEDEAEGDAEYAMTRLRFSATWDGRWYRLRMQAENRLYLANGVMVEGVRTDGFRTYVDRLADDVQVSLTNTLRRY